MVYVINRNIPATRRSSRGLGVKFSQLGNFAKWMKNCFDKASRSMISLIQTARKKYLPIHVILDLYRYLYMVVKYGEMRIWI